MRGRRAARSPPHAATTSNGRHEPVLLAVPLRQVRARPVWQKVAEDPGLAACFVGAPIHIWRFSATDGHAPRRSRTPTAVRCLCVVIVVCVADHRGQRQCGS